jgi:hypothetical protein
MTVKAAEIELSIAIGIYVTAIYEKSIPRKSNVNHIPFPIKKKGIAMNDWPGAKVE